MKRTRSGMTLLISVLILGAVAISIGASMAIRGIEEVDIGRSTVQTTETFAVTDSCIEEALLQLKRQGGAFTGTTLTVGDGVCSVSVTDSSPTFLLASSGTILQWTRGIYEKVTVSGSYVLPKLWRHTKIATEYCTNGVDDDGDGLVDCADIDDCVTGAVCQAGGSCYSALCCGDGVADAGEECNEPSLSCSGFDTCNTSICRCETCTSGSAPTCNGITATIYVDGCNTIVGGPDDGNTYAGTLNGSASDDIMVGTDAADTIFGNAGADTICGLAGNDTIQGNDGADTILGGDDDDDVNGGDGADVILGGDGTDTIAGGNDADTLTGGEGNDTITGDDGDDAITGGNGNDALSGGEGADTIIADDGNDVLNGENGDDILCAGAGDDTILGGANNDSIDGSSGTDSIDGEAGTDICRNMESSTTCEDFGSAIAECGVSADPPPTITTLSPADEATGVSTTTNLVITFSEAVDPEAGASNDIIIKKVSDGTTVETIDAQSAQVTGGGTATITVDPSVTLSNSTAYYVQIGVDAFDDTASNSFAGISDSTTWNFTTGGSVLATQCGNGIDDDGNSDIDCADPECLATQNWYDFAVDPADHNTSLPTFEMVDIDNDGDLDVVFTRGGSGLILRGDIYWYESDGATPPVFTQHTVDNTSPEFTKLTVGQVNDEDSYKDIVAASYQNLYWFKNDGSQNFTRYDITTTIYSPQTISAVFIVDWNSDGQKDILVFYQDSSSGGANVYENNGAENFTEKVLLAGDPYTIGFPGDFDGDGRLDIVVADQDSVDWYRNQDNSTVPFSWQSTLASGYRGFDIYAATLDNDSDLDVLVGGANGVHWYQNDGAGSFAAKTDINSLATFLVSVLAADMDEDGDNDVIASKNSNLYYYANGGGADPTFSAGQAIFPDGTYYSTSLRAGFLKNDTDRVVAISMSGGAGGIHWFDDVGIGNCYELIDDEGGGGACLANGQSCPGQTDVCCSGFCDPTGPMICGECTYPTYGEWCETDSNCCNGESCIFNMCQ